MDLKQSDSVVSVASRIQGSPHPCFRDYFQLGPLLLFHSRKKKENTQGGTRCAATTHDSGFLNLPEKDWTKHHCQS